jgi:hypothetical protein
MLQRMRWESSSDGYQMNGILLRRRLVGMKIEKLWFMCTM